MPNNALDSLLKATEQERNDISRLSSAPRLVVESELYAND